MQVLHPSGCIGCVGNYACSPIHKRRPTNETHLLRQPSFDRKAWHTMQISWEALQPGVHQTNARVERCNRGIFGRCPSCIGSGRSAIIVLALCGSTFLPQWQLQNGRRYQCLVQTVLRALLGHALPLRLWIVLLARHDLSAPSKADPECSGDPSWIPPRARGAFECRVLGG